jgi:intracellular septation protein
MQLLFDLLPILVFVAAYAYAGIYAATAAIIVAMAAQIAFQWFRHRKVSNMLLVSGVLVAVLGGVTLALRNPLFIYWKPTIANWLFAAAFLGSRLFTSKTLIERVMGHAVELNAAMWRQLNAIWVASFFLLGALNLVVVYNFDEPTWVKFKVVMVGLMFLIAIGQAVWIAARTSQGEHKESR